MIQRVRGFILTTALLTLLNCKASREEIITELQRFDVSLDSLIQEETFPTTAHLIFQSDTLFDHPIMVVETCYQVMGTDSIHVKANGHRYAFDRHELVGNAGEDYSGNTFVTKYFYFQNTVDNRLMEARSNLSDTTTVAYVKRYNAKGQLVKLIRSYLSKSTQNGVTFREDYRLLEVTRYNADHTVTVWSRLYANKPYYPDSLRNTKVRQSTYVQIDLWAADKKEYMYVYDEHGNWIVKRRKGENPDVYYRTYTY